MELTYKVRGADGSEYGPATLDQLNAWLNEGRVQPQSEVLRSDQNTWATAASFPELSIAAGPSPTMGTPVASTMSNDAAAMAQMKSGASWFYWIAGLSLINSIAAYSGGQWGFALGLGTTQFTDALGQVQGGNKMIALAISLVIIGVVALFGLLANKAHTWAFVVGMFLYSFDSVITLLIQSWLSLAFHVLALFCIFRGAQACRRLKAA